MSGYTLEAGSRVRFAYGSEAWAFARKREKVRVVSRVVVFCHETKPDRLTGGTVHSVIVYLRGSRFPVLSSELVPVMEQSGLSIRRACKGGAA